MKISPRICTSLLLFTFAAALGAQPALVTSQLETNRVPVGASTVLHVFAQIAPEYQGGYAQIFSWNVDALLNGTPASFDATGVLRSNSDNDPESSSPGTLDGPNIRSIRDSFLNNTNAGRSEPIELFSVPVKAIEPGTALISIQAGALADEPDFVVEPIGDGPTLIGGNYQAAQVQLTVLAPLTNIIAKVTQTPLPQNGGNLITISFPTLNDYNYFVEGTTNVIDPVSWQALPNAPYNSGFADDTNSVPFRFYRVRAVLTR